MSVRFGKRNGTKLVWYQMFHEILPRLSGKHLSFYNTRKENSLIRLHIGHSYLTHSFILRKEQTPVCVVCNTALTIKHILIESTDLSEVRKKYFEQKSLYSHFQDVSPEIIFDFLREVVCFIKYEVCYGNGYVKYIFKNCSNFYVERFTVPFINVFYKI